MERTLKGAIEAIIPISRKICLNRAKACNERNEFVKRLSTSSRTAFIMKGNAIRTIQSSDNS